MSAVARDQDAAEPPWTWLDLWQAAALVGLVLAVLADAGWLPGSGL